MWYRVMRESFWSQGRMEPATFITLNGKREKYLFAYKIFCQMKSHAKKDAAKEEPYISGVGTVCKQCRNIKKNAGTRGNKKNTGRE